MSIIRFGSERRWIGDEHFEEGVQPDSMSSIYAYPTFGAVTFHAVNENGDPAGIHIENADWIELVMRTLERAGARTEHDEFKEIRDALVEEFPPGERFPDDYLDEPSVLDASGDEEDDLDGLERSVDAVAVDAFAAANEPVPAADIDPHCHACDEPLPESWADEPGDPPDCPQCGQNPLPPVGGGEEDSGE